MLVGVDCCLVLLPVAVVLLPIAVVVYCCASVR